MKRRFGKWAVMSRGVVVDRDGDTTPTRYLLDDFVTHCAFNTRREARRLVKQMRRDGRTARLVRMSVTFETAKGTLL